jgi:flagellar motility protein MotE (MotC chaperone)
MRRMMIALAAVYRRWRFVEDAAPASSAPVAPLKEESSEVLRIRRAIEREEERIADCRRNGRSAMARERETTLRSLRNRLAALDLAPRRAI